MSNLLRAERGDVTKGVLEIGRVVMEGDAK
jgi:hypothetical protein